MCLGVVDFVDVDVEEVDVEDTSLKLKTINDFQTNRFLK